jgi:hypothetical protein
MSENNTEYEALKNANRLPWYEKPLTAHELIIAIAVLGFIYYSVIRGIIELINLIKGIF